MLMLLDAINAMTEEAFGYPVYGYWKFFCEDDAASICDKNVRHLESDCDPFKNRCLQITDRVSDIIAVSI
jgi:hypothetical protein